ncbi:MAG: hypothetical protein LBT29_00100 [Flavobacteriaceae bacterium]|jgi:hypothetical protein|nr:hypothetical protein [Flavobacteriaceae bacterium]
MFFEMLNNLKQKIMYLFTVTPNRNIGGKCEVEKDEAGKIKNPTVKIPNNKVIEKWEFITIASEYSPSRIQIEKAYKEKLGKEIKGSLSTDFFTIKKN